MQGKSLLVSKTFWVNFVVFLIALVGILLDQSWITDHADWVAKGGAVLAFLNVVLRLLTGQPITSFTTPKPPL